MSIDDTDKFEQKEMKKRPVKNTWHDRLINYIPEPLRKSAGGFKDIFLKIKTPEQTVYGRGKKLSKPKTQYKIRNLFILKKKKNKLKIG